MRRLRRRGRAAGRDDRTWRKCRRSAAAPAADAAASGVRGQVGDDRRDCPTFDRPGIGRIRPRPPVTIRANHIFAQTDSSRPTSDGTPGVGFCSFAPWHAAQLFSYTTRHRRNRRHCRRGLEAADLASSRPRAAGSRPPPCSARRRCPSRGFAAVVPQFDPPWLPGIEIESSSTTGGMNRPPSGPGAVARLRHARAHRLVFLGLQQPRVDVVDRERLARRTARASWGRAASATTSRRARRSAAPAVPRSARAARRSRD